MFQPTGTRPVYLPEGRWYDYWTDRRFEGARWMEYEADLETLPLFVRAGAVITMGPELQFADEQAWDPLSFDIYPGPEGTSNFEISDDRRHLRFRLTVSGDQVVLEGGPLQYEAQLRVHRDGAPPISGQLGRAVAVR